MAKILVVDDDLGTRQALKYILRSHDITAVSGGHKALGLLSQQRFDLVFLDVFMPDVGGFDVLEAATGTKVIMMSAVEDTEIVVQAMKHGAVHFITKDFDHDAILQLVNQYLR